MSVHAWQAAVSEIEAGERGPQVAAIFDFDGTLIPGYSELAFVRQRLRDGELGLVEIARAAQMAIGLATGRADKRELIELGLREWKGRKAAAMERLGQQVFASAVEPEIFPEMRAIIDAHRRMGHTLLVASSATHFQVGPAAAHLGIGHVLCTRLSQRRGVLTGRVDGPILFGPGKAEAVRDFAARNGVDLGRSWFYADGDEDEALMHLVGHPRPTQPQPQLARVAARRGWPVRRFTSRGRPDTALVLRNLAATASAVPVLAGAAALRLLTGRKRDAANLVTGTLTDIALALGGVELEVAGEQHLWEARPAVFIWNHRNIFDAQIVGNLVRRDFGAVAKKELERVPLFAAASRFMHIAFVDRRDSHAAIESLKPATELLRRGVSMVVAPEGTRAGGRTVAPFKKGAFRMAMDAGVPIVPIVIRNADDVGSRDAGVMRPATVDVVVLPPIPVTDWTLEDLDERIASVRQLFVDTLARWPGRSRAPN
jgi:putative phosphoserine phosphatase/1-acylglycerol-3-phosphate O-acyltransferase